MRNPIVTLTVSTDDDADVFTARPALRITPGGWEGETVVLLGPAFIGEHAVSAALRAGQAAMKDMTR